MHNSLSELMYTGISKRMEEVDDNISRHYNLYIKDLYLTDFYYKGFKFTVTGAECTMLETIPNIKHENTEFVIRQKFGYEWNIELSLSIINKVKLSLRDYKRLINGSDECHHMLDEVIKRELAIND